MAYLFTFIAVLVLVSLVFFQIALIFGAPLGNYAWGGGSKVLSKQLRIASFTSIILYSVFAIFIAGKAGWLDVINNQQILNIGMWVFTFYFFIGIGMNAISRSKPERNLMTPVAAVLAVCFLAVTIG